MRIKLFIIAVFFSASIFAQTKQWTLQQCVQHALKHNISVKQIKNTILINEQDVIAAKGAFLPSVGANVSQGLNLGSAQLFSGTFANRTSLNTNFGVQVSETIFNGFRNKNRYKQSQLNKETNTLELERIKDDIALNVVNAYLNILFNKENLAIAKNQHQFTLKQLKQVNELVDAGVQPRANIYDVEATLSNDLQKITSVQNSLELAKLTLAQLLQVPFKGFDVAAIDLGTPSVNLMYNAVEPVLNYAYQNRNEVKVAEKNIENAQLNTEISKSGYLPNVTLSYNFGTNVFNSNLTNDAAFFNQLQDNKGHNFNLGINIPIFSKFQNKTAVAKSRIQEDNAQLNLEQTKLTLESNIQRAFTDAKAALKTYEASKTSLKAQKISFSNSQERYKIGAMNAFDLEQARIRLLNAASSLVNAKYDFVFKTKVLDFYAGKAIVLN